MNKLDLHKDHNLLVDIINNKKIVYITCIERADTGFSLRRNLKPTAVTLVQHSNYYSLSFDARVIDAIPVNGKKKISVGGGYNAMPFVSVFSTYEDAVAFYNLEIDCTVDDFNRTIEYFVKKINDIQKGRIGV
jgi:hypothetical protein